MQVTVGHSVMGRPGAEDRDPPLKAEDRAPYAGRGGQRAGVGDEVARGEVVGPVEDEVVVADDPE
jgi:hypothetical protein